MYFGPCQGKVLTASGSVKGSCGTLWAVAILSNGTQAGYLVLKDGGSTGAEIFRLSVPATAGDSRYLSFPQGINFGVDLYAVLTNLAGASFVVS